MIKHEYHSTLKDGTILNKFFSDESRYLVHNGTNAEYDAVIDKAGNEVNYTEGDIIPSEETDMGEATIDDLYNALAELGVSNE